LNDSKERQQSHNAIKARRKYRYEKASEMHSPPSIPAPRPSNWSWSAD